MNWYLAGKIAQGDWRCDVVQGLREACAQNHYLHQGDSGRYRTTGWQWPTLENAVLGVPGWHYVGPFFTRPLPDERDFDRCDSGGTLGFAHGLVDCSGHGCIDRSAIYTRCMEALDRADSVLAWIDSSDCYGTLVEVGYARALGKRVIVAGPAPGPDCGPSRGGYDEMWMAFECENFTPYEERPHSPAELLLWVLWKDLGLGERIEHYQRNEMGWQGYLARFPHEMAQALLALEAKRSAGLEAGRRDLVATPIRLDPQRAFTPAQKKEIYLRSNGHCQACAKGLDLDWHTDHVVPHARGGKTEVINGQALCGPCNQRKHAKVLTVEE